MRSGEVAGLAGVSTDTLRHYERKGLLAASRAENGYREYPPQALGRVRLVQGALAMGFTLDELSRLLGMRDRGGAPCRQVRALAAARLEQIEAQIHEMTVLRDEMRGLLAEWDDRLAARPEGERAFLLDGLIGAGAEHADRAIGVPRPGGPRAKEGDWQWTGVSAGRRAAVGARW